MAEVQQAAQKFGENIGQILYHEDVLKSAMENWEKAYRDLKRIEQLQQICKEEKTEPRRRKNPRTDPTPEPADPTPKPNEPTPNPTEPTPTPTEEPPAAEPDEGKRPVTQEKYHPHPRLASPGR